MSSDNRRHDTDSLSKRLLRWLAIGSFGVTLVYAFAADLLAAWNPSLIWNR